MIGDFRQDEAPHMGDISGNAPEHRSFRLLGVLDFCHSNVDIGFSRPKPATFFWGRGLGGLSRHQSDTCRESVHGLYDSLPWTLCIFFP